MIRRDKIRRILIKIILFNTRIAEVTPNANKVVSKNKIIWIVNLYRSQKILLAR